MLPDTPLPLSADASTPFSERALRFPVPARPFLPSVPEVWGDHLATLAEARLSWLWQGYLAPANVTLLTSLWKSGKTTLLSVLLARLKNGGLLAGLPLAPGKAIVVSEESLGRWQLRGQQLDLGNHLCFLCRPFSGKPRPEQWLALLDRLADLHARHRFHLLVIDPLASFLPGRDESNAAAMLQFLAPLQALSSLGLSVLLAHHPTKGEPLAGQAARGSGALSAYVDILIEMTRPRSAPDTDRRRRLRGYSRYDDTPRQLVIELDAAGTDYLVRGDFDSDEFTRNWSYLQMVLEDADDKWTRQQLLAGWPADFEKPHTTTLWRWLQRALEQQLVCQDGTGRANDPFRYWLPAKMAQWQKDPVYQLLHPDLSCLKDLHPDWASNPPPKKRRKR